MQQVASGVIRDHPRESIQHSGSQLPLDSRPFSTLFAGFRGYLQDVTGIIILHLRERNCARCLCLPRCCLSLARTPQHRAIHGTSYQKSQTPQWLLTKTSFCLLDEQRQSSKSSIKRLGVWEMEHVQSVLGSKGTVPSPPLCINTLT